MPSIVKRSLLAAGALVALGLTGSSLAQVVLPTPNTTLPVYFTDAQVMRGEQRFTITCGGCHSQLDLARAVYANYPNAAAVYDFISLSMPADAPGSLLPQQYADIISYFLRLLTFPSGGTTELSATNRMVQMAIVPSRGTPPPVTP